MLEIQNITKSFGQLDAVKNVSFEIEPGELVSLVGPSGSGKSTILNMIGGHLKPTSGTIRNEEQDITDTSPQNRPTSTVFQSWALFPHMSVRENIEFPMNAQDKSINQKVESLLNQVQLEPDEYLEKQVNELSGGERQRVALARGIAYDPDILLLDEPLASLDYVLQKRLRRELSDLNEELDITFVYVTHSLESALTMSDRVFILQDGSLVQLGTPTEIYQKPENRFIAEFLGDANVFLLNSVTAKDGIMQVSGPEFDKSINVDAVQNTHPDCMIVRQDDATVAPDLACDIGIEATVDKTLLTGHRILVETNSVKSSEEYVATMDYDDAADLNRGDSVYFQWNKEDVILVPE